MRLDVLRLCRFGKSAPCRTQAQHPDEAVSAAILTQPEPPVGHDLDMFAH